MVKPALHMDKAALHMGKSTFHTVKSTFHTVKSTFHKGKPALHMHKTALHLYKAGVKSVHARVKVTAQVTVCFPDENKQADNQGDNRPCIRIEHNQVSLSRCCFKGGAPVVPRWGR